MDAATKNRVVLILTALTVVFFLTSVASCFNGRREKADRDREMASRMDLEEKLGKVTAEMKNAINDLGRSLNEEKKAHQATRAELSQAQSLNDELMHELDRSDKLKDTLEDDLKDALVGPSQKKDKP